VTTDEGVWISLDAASIQSYCHDQSGEAWCLVRSSDGDVFLRAQSESADPPSTGSQPLAFTTQPRPLAAKGFDFTKASRTPTFSPFTVTSLPPGGWSFAVTGVFSILIHTWCFTGLSGELVSKIKQCVL